MYPTDVKEFTASRLVAAIAQALATGAALELRPLYEELDLAPTTIASYHAAAAAVHVLLAEHAGRSLAAAPRPQLAAPRAVANGQPAKKANGARAPQRLVRSGGSRKRRAKSNSTRANKSAGKRAMLQCPVCKQPFMTQGRLTNHLRDRHNGGDSALPQSTSSATAGGAA